MGVPDLVALLDAAPAGLRTLRGEVRRWQDVEAVSRAMRRWNESRHAVYPRGVQAGETPRPGVHELWTRVWYAAPDRWREEEGGVLRLGRDDRRWDGDASAVTERRTPAAGVGHALEPLLFPGALLGAFRFVDVTGTTALGRACLRARTVRRRGHGARHRAAGPVRGLLDHRVTVDAEHGILLRDEALLDGEPVDVTELTALVVDEPLGDDTFRLPAGVAVRTVAEERARQLREAGADPAGVDLDDDSAVAGTLLRARHVAAGPPWGEPGVEDAAAHYVPWDPPPADPAAAEAAIRAAFHAHGATDATGTDLVNVQGGE
ncbi:MAG TPA: hypothetical protein VFI47_17265, partial [Acidimicrobiales bacterium]|nr:hypothetical protein [Acidimicrobiales bacterium]